MSGLLLSLVLASAVPDTALQMILVVTPDASAHEGTLTRYERVSTESPWIPVGEPASIVLGPSGLGGGSGLHSDPLPGLPPKEEGDGRSPAGVFALTTAFGFAASPDLQMPYVELETATECVDDPRSRYYNRIVSRERVDEPDWSSSERMRSIPGYVWGVVVDHNPEATPGAGSCIFLHVWSAPGKPTAGCTAMDRATMEAIAAWLDPEASPVLVQLTAELVDELGERWRLPSPRSATDSDAP